MASCEGLCIVLLFLDIITFCLAFQAPGFVRDVCYYEEFKARCNTDEIIVMEIARYGNLGSGKCFDEDAGDVMDCASDVLAIADRKCSGRRNCTMTIPNADFDASKKCFQRIKGFFQGKYTCQKVLPLSGLCQPGKAIQLSNTPTTISSHDISQSSCPSTIRNLNLHASPGQQVNITLIDFTWGTSQSSCLSYGHVVDRQMGRRVALCGGQHRQSTVMVSISSTVRLELVPVGADKKFLLEFQAIGCGDLAPPKGAWMNRSHTEVTMGCQGSSQVWSLRCHQGQWLGPKIECPHAPYEEQKEVDNNTSQVSLPNDIIITIIGSIAFLLAVAIITAGVIFYKRSERQKMRILQQQQQMYKTIRLRAKPSNNPNTEDPIYLSPAFVQQSRPTSGHRPESAYESIHVFNRTMSDTSTLPPPPPALLAPPDSQPGTLRQGEEDPYNASQSSSSTYTNPLKYFVLDKNLVTITNK